MEKTFDANELSSIEVTFSQEDQDKLDQIVDLNLESNSLLKKQQSEDKTLDDNLLQITDIQKKQVSQNETILNSLENLTSITKQNDTPETVVKDPVIAAIEDLKTENANDNKELINQIETIKIEGFKTDNKDVVDELSKLNASVKDLSLAYVDNSKIIDNSTKQNTEILTNLNDNTKQYSSINSNYQKQLETIEVNNKNVENLTKLQQQTVENLNQNNTNISEVQKTIQQNQVEQNNLQQTTNQNFEKSLEQISVSNKTNEQNVKNVSQSLENFNTVQQKSENTNLTNNESLNQQFSDFQETQNLVVKEEVPKIVERLDNLTVLQNSSVEKIEQLKQNTEKNNIEKNNVSTSTNNINAVNNPSPAILTPKKTNDDDVDLTTLAELIGQGIQIQAAMANLLQQLVDGQNLKRYTDNPIKN